VVVVGPVVVVAEDEEALRRLVTHILRERLDADVRATSDGAEALDLLETLRPHLLLLDLDMPRVHGLEVARRVRANPRLADLPILAMSGWAAGDAALGAGSDAFLPKPFRAEALVARINALIGPPDPERRHAAS
jgi:CheY-like chemotaxis protein